ncbi:MAG: gluconeogenesis factor YvcK family protein, partial [Acidobacteriota bacterium]
MATASRIKWVAIGGGTGLATLLRGLRPHLGEVALTAIVTVTDDGHSSGRLREEFGVLPPGDIRNCLVALSDPNLVMTRLFAHRFPGEGELGGHSLGNLLILGLTQLTPDLLSATDEARALLGIDARVLPATLDPVDLVGLVGDREVRGQVAIKARKEPIRRLSIAPDDARALDQAVHAILEADVITLGPGSLYTSVIANLLIDGIRQALTDARGMKVYICNVMSEADETESLTATDHITELLSYAGDLKLDYALFNSSPISAEMRDRYALEGAIALPVPELTVLPGTETRLICMPLASEEGFVRHD